MLKPILALPVWAASVTHKKSQNHLEIHCYMPPGSRGKPQNFSYSIPTLWFRWLTNTVPQLWVIPLKAGSSCLLLWRPQLLIWLRYWCHPPLTAVKTSLAHPANLIGLLSFPPQHISVFHPRRDLSEQPGHFPIKATVIIALPAGTCKQPLVWESQDIIVSNSNTTKAFENTPPPSEIRNDLDFLKVWSRSPLRGWRTIAHALRVSSDPISATSSCGALFHFWGSWLPINLGSSLLTPTQA